MRRRLARILLCIAALAAGTAAHGEGIENEGATLVLLPSTQYSRSPWAGWTYNVNKGAYVQWGQELDCQGTPPTDRYGRKWYEPAYTRTDGEFSWERHNAPYSSDAWYNGLPSYRWTYDYNVADLYVRRSFTLQGKLPTNVFLSCGHDDGVSHFYINGTLVRETDTGWNNAEYMRLSNAQKALLKTDGTENIIALHVHNNYGGAFADCGLYAIPDVEGGADPAEALVATEVTVANIDQTIDYSFNYGAWLELYNKAEENVSLGNIYISDNPEQMDKFCLPSTYGTIAPGKYACIFFDHNSADGTYGSTARKQVGFKLNTEGGSIYLSEDGKTPFMRVDYPAAIARCSWARKSPGSEEWGYNGSPTPGAANTAHFAEVRLDAPVPDTDSKLFSSSFRFSVEIPEGATLRFTTDGTAPTLTNGKTSSEGTFYVVNTSCYRFRLFRDGYLPSPVVTRSFIYRDKDYYLPVMSITTKGENLYGDSIGIYVDGVNGVDGRNHGKSNINMDWERPVNVEYITPDGTMAINQEAEMCISGGWSRHYAPASFKIKAAKLYEGQNSLDFPFFKGNPYKKYKQLLIRNGGNDNDTQRHGRVRDAITQEVLTSSGFYVDAQMYQPIHVFFNGKYIGMLNLREPNNKYNGTASYGYDDDLMDAFEYSNGYFQMAGTKEAFTEWHRLSQNARDEATYEKIKQLVDIDEVVNYFAAITYIGCTDWICNNNNSKGYRSLPDGKFHLTVLDQDWGWGNQGAVSTLSSYNGNELAQIFNGMRQNKDFQRQFVNAYCILGGSVFTPERCNAIGDSICNLVEAALSYENREPWTSFGEQRASMTTENSRAQRQDALRRVFALGQGMKVRVRSNTPQAALMLDNQAVPGGTFDGTLYAPVTLTASAPAGYVFDGWKAEGQVSLETKEVFPRASQWQYWDEGSIDEYLWNQPSCDFKAWKTGDAPLGYGGRGEKPVTTMASFHPSYYLRKTFTLESEPKEGDIFTLNLGADDGFILYINGTETERYLMPEGAVTYETLAVTHAPDPYYEAQMQIPAGLLHKGENTIAVRIHNNVLTSSDIFWAASLTQSTESENYIHTQKQLTLTQDRDLDLTAVFHRVKEGAPVRINEVSAENDIYVNDYHKRADWLELYNTTDRDIDLEGMFLSDDAGEPEKYKIAAADGVSTIIPAHGTKVVWADRKSGISQMHAPFKLENADGAVVTLQAADGSWADALCYTEHDSKGSFGRYPNGGSVVFQMSIPTIEKDNVLGTYDFLLGEIAQEERPITTTFALKEGWNWASHNLSEAYGREDLPEQVSIIRSQREEIYKDSILGWVGTLTSMRPATGYKIRTESDCEMTMDGFPYDTTIPVAVAKGWNWLGCPLSKATVLSEALSGLQATEGDRIVGFDDFAIYEDGKWSGSLRTLVPSHAYMLHAGRSQTFCWNALTRETRRSRKYAAAEEDEEDTLAKGYSPHSYPEVMNIIATVVHDGERESLDGCKVLAYAGEECRGEGFITEGKTFLTVHGDGEEELSFSILDEAGTEFPATEKLRFSALQLEGTTTLPYQLHITDSEDIMCSNPADTILTTKYYNLAGQQLPYPCFGVCIQRTFYKNGKIISKKVLR